MAIVGDSERAMHVEAEICRGKKSQYVDRTATTTSQTWVYLASTCDFRVLWSDMWTSRRITPRTTSTLIIKPRPACLKVNNFHPAFLINTPSTINQLLKPPPEAGAEGLGLTYQTTSNPQEPWALVLGHGPPPYYIPSACQVIASVRIAAFVEYTRGRPYEPENRRVYESHRLGGARITIGDFNFKLHGGTLQESERILEEDSMTESVLKFQVHFQSDTYWQYSSHGDREDL